MHELFEHTADLGLRASAPTLDELFSEMAACLTAAMLDNPDSVRDSVSADFDIPGGDREYLLFDWLRALLFHFDDSALIFARAAVTIGPAGLKATAWGEPLDRSRHQLSREVKAITYHGLTVAETAGGWLAEAIVDI